MLTIYRRHRKDCDHKSEGRKYRRCRCPIWADGFLASKEIRQSLGMRDWEEASETIQKWEAQGRQTSADESEPISIAQATEEFVTDAKARNLREKTVYKYRFLFAQLKSFAGSAENNADFAEDLPIVVLDRAEKPFGQTEWRRGWDSLSLCVPNGTSGGRWFHCFDLQRVRAMAIVSC